MTPPGISCVIPVFNESQSVAATLAEVSRHLAASDHPHEIILVDDGSTDKTREAALAAGVDFRLVRHESNRGYGAAVKTGCRQAKHSWILIIDADGSYPPGEIALLLSALQGDEPWSMIVGQRSQTQQTDGFFRLRGKAILVSLANFLSGMSIPDINSGLRLMRKGDLERYWTLLPDGFSLTTTITLALLCSGEPVRYVPIEYRKRQGKSKIRPLRDMWNFTVLILRTMIYFNPLKVFVPLSALFIAAAFAVVIFTKLSTGRVMDVTALFLFIAGLQMLLIGVVADLIFKLAAMRAGPREEQHDPDPRT